MIRLNNSILKKIDLTYLIKFETIDEARQARNEIECRINSVFHYILSINRAHVGDPDDRTVYLNVRNYPSVRVYVKWKDNPLKKKHSLHDGSNCLDENIKKEIYKHSECRLRIELKVKMDYLERFHPDMVSVIAWKEIEKSKETIANIFQKFRLMLRLDENLRR